MLPDRHETHTALPSLTEAIPEAHEDQPVTHPHPQIDQSSLPDESSIPVQDGSAKDYGEIPVLSPPRPPMSVKILEEGLATREASTVSQASFATAPETLEEQEALIQAETDSSEDDSDDSKDIEDSDTATVRGDEAIQRSRTTTQELSDSAPSSNSNERTVSSADSRKSLLPHPPPTLPLAQQNMLSRQGNHGSNLVRFTTETPTKISENQKVLSMSVCEEASTLNKRHTAQQHHFSQHILRNPFRKPKEIGELLRAERMLLRIEYAPHGGVPDNYCDTSARRINRRVHTHWREFLVAARNDEQGRVVLNFHRNRAIPRIAKQIAKIKAAHNIIIDPATTKCNLYSSLDKTIVLWCKAKKGTMLYILRPHTAHSSIEWYAFIQATLGKKPRSTAVINVPNLQVKLRIDLRSGSSAVDDDEEEDETDELDIASINEEGQIVADGVAITGEFLLKACWRSLSRDKEWATVLKDWKENERMGLCWRRYDRLEWIHGHDAKQLVGQWAMEHTHELEFRPKEHYQTEVRLPNGKKISEPSPLEGFLVRLTSSTGRQARFGKVFYKRLYFSTHDHLLFFAKPELSVPPPPPDFNTEGVEDIGALVESSPLQYTIDPYPLADGKIAWLAQHVSQEEKASKNQVATTEAARRTGQLHVSDGYIDLSKVVKIRRCQRMPIDDAEGIGHDGGGVCFEPTNGNEDGISIGTQEGIVDEFDDARVFELVLDTGLVVRLQAYDKDTRDAWMSHLSKLVKYWTHKIREDQMHFKTMKQSNMELLKIDEEVESLVGQFGNKWEVSQCVSEPRIYNFCPISSCRTMALHGILYRKPRVHSTFKKYQCVVSHGKLFVYNHMHYDAGGTQEYHIHHSRRQIIDLRDCYIFSGVVAESDLLSTRDASDREGPGRHSLPRLYNDGWTSQDEQEALCFVLWSGRKRMALTGIDRKDAKDNKVSRLGVAGKHMIYMARCRQERDLWVQVISNEIQRSWAAGTV